MAAANFNPCHFPVARPLVPVAVAMVLADRGEDYVLAAIETGAIGFAWDIRGRAAAAREIRMWRDSLLAWLANPVMERAAGPVRLQDDRAILGSLFLHSRPELRGTELQRMFSCGHSHVINLIKDGLLTATTKAGSGPRGSPRITRASVINFLSSRRVV